MNQHVAIGVDVGGSHISSAAVNLETGTILRETAAGRAVNNQDQAFRIVSEWSSCLQETIEKLPSAADLSGIGFAMPGPFDYVNGIALFRGVPKYENLYGFNIADAIRSSLDLAEGVPVRFMNDATSFAMGEAWAGKSAQVSRSVAITLGTGFGSAFIAGRSPVADGPLVPELGCLYHLPFENGIADDYFSTRWFINQYRECTGKEAEGVREIAAVAPAEPQVKVIFDRFGRNLGRFLAPWLKGFGAETLVIGGNISHSWGLFGEALTGELTRNGCKTMVAISDLKEDAALLGSAYLINESFWKSVQKTLPLM